MPTFTRAGHISAFRHGGVSLIVVVLVATIVEALIIERRGRSYPWREAGASLAVAIVQRVATAGSALALAPLFAALWEHRLATFALPQPYAAIAVFLLVEFAYYWMHRASHSVGWMWATHSVHHSAEHLTLPSAIRLGGTGAISLEWVPFVPLVIAGVSPETISIALAANLAYQFFLHTELIPRLGPIEWIFNTPSAHRVHHATNPDYLDRNFGGVLVIFDRLFGTYVAERASEIPRYGLVGEIRGTNPFRVLANGWIRLFQRRAAL